MSHRAPATGDRTTRKVRHLAAVSGLGEIRHVSAATLNGPGWTAVVGAVAVFSLGPWLVGNAGPTTAVGMAVFCTLLAAGILWWLGAEKVVVLDRGILVGSFGPFLRPYALPFAAFDLRTVRAAVGNQRTLGLLLGGRGITGASRTVLWSRRAVTFVGVATTVARHAPAGSADLATAREIDLWVFSARDPRRQERLVRAIGDAARSAGAPGADQVEALGLPARPVEVSPQGADRLAIPDRLRSARARHPQPAR